MRAQNRNILIDVLKGYAILLVVLGHAVQYNLPGSFDSSVLFKVIYSFHMPLFMFLSGYVNVGTFDGSCRKLGKRLQVLLIPYMSWFLLMFVWQCMLVWFRGGVYPDFLKSLSGLWKSPDREALWFLWVLALNCLILFFALRISRRYVIGVLACFVIALNVVVWQLQTSYLGLVQLSWHLIFFSTGYAFALFKVEHTRMFRLLSYASFVLFPLLVIGWTRAGQMPLWLLLLKGITPENILSYIYTLLVPLTGILFSFGIMTFCIRISSRFRDTLTYFGRVTLEIYSTHFLVFTLVFVIRHYPYWIQLLISSFAALTFSFYFQLLMKKCRLTAFLLYGKQAEKAQKND